MLTTTTKALLRLLYIPAIILLTHSDVLIMQVPMEITVTLSNPGLALKRQQSWEQVKANTAKNVSRTSISAF